jgi:hypothetical protein
MRDALRAIFGLESGKKRLGWVEDNRTTNTANGMLTRGTNFPLSDFRLDQFGPLKENGQSMFIDQIGVTSGQFAMSIKGWSSTKIPLVNGQAGAKMTTIIEAGENKYLPGSEISVSEVKIHPELPDVKLFIGTRDVQGKPVKAIAYTLGDGRIIESSTSHIPTALKELRKKLIAREDAIYIDSILNEYRYNRDKPLPGTQAAGAMTVEQRTRLNKPFDEVAVDRHGWQDDAMVVAQGYDTVTDTNFTTTEVGDKFQAHGMTKQVGPNTAIKSVIELFNTGIDNKKNFHTAPYRLPSGTSVETRAGIGAGLGTGGGEAWREGPITLVGRYGSDINSVSDIGFVVVNDGAFKDPNAVVSLLQERLPDGVKVIKMSEEGVHLVKPSETAAGTPEQPAGRQAPASNLEPSTNPPNTRTDAPYMTPAEIAATREFRVGPDGKITRVTEAVKTEYERWRLRYDAIVKKRQQEAKAAATAAERERRIFFAEQNRRAQVEIDSEENFAAQSRKRAQQIAERDAKEAARLQKEADQAQARADALRLNFERGMDAARAAADIKRAETNKLIEHALSSNQPLIAPGLLLVDANRLTVQPFRMAVATDTVRTPSVTTRTGILYLKNMAGFEGQTQAHQQAFFNYLFAEQIGKGKAIATEAFRGPMAAQQGINLLNSRLWVAENSGARLLREYRNADKAAGRDLVTYKVYGANGMLIKQTNDAQDAVEAIGNLERRFINTLKGPTPLVTEDNAGTYLNQVTNAYLTQPASARPKGNIPSRESKTMQIEGFERYLPAKKR